MAPNQDKMADAKLNLIKQWIEQGMPENSGSVIKKKNNAAAAMLTSSSSGKPDGPPPMPEKLLKQPAIYTARPAAIAALAASPWAPLVAVAGQEQVSLYHTENGQLLGVIPSPKVNRNRSLLPGMASNSNRWWTPRSQWLRGTGRHCHRCPHRQSWR